jgi:phage-related protein
MAADQNLTREQAFMQAVMEQGETSMAKIGEQSGTTAASMAQVQAQLENLKISIGTALLPILGELAKAVTPLIQEIGPVLVDVAGQVGGVITSDVIPALLPLVKKLLPPILDLLPSIVSLFALLASNLMEALAPVLDTLVLVLIDLIDQFTPLLETLLPPLIDLFSSLMKVVEPILTIATSLLSNIVIPLIELLLPPLIDLLDKVVGVVSSLAGWLADHLQPAFDAIGDAISNVIGWFESLKDKLSNIHLPDWLTPGSPTPFELGLRGIASALKEVNGDIGGLTVNAASQPVASPTTVVVNVSSMMSLADMADAELKLQPIINNAVRRALA